MNPGGNIHPKELLQILLIGFVVIWQTPLALLSLVVYMVFSVFSFDYKNILIIGSLTTVFAIMLHMFLFGDTLSYLCIHGYQINTDFWKIVLNGKVNLIGYFLIYYDLFYLLTFPLLIAGGLGFIRKQFTSPHEQTLKALQKGKLIDQPKELSKKRLENLLSKYKDEWFDGTLLGVSTDMGRPVVVPDHYINQMVLVLGTTGSGKTITLRRFFQQAIRKGYPLIIVDGKPTDENVDWVSRHCEKFGRHFYGFNCGNYFHYDPLAHGGYTELKDKIITLKDQWENDYYRSIAEDYLQTALEVLLKSERSFSLKTIADCLTPNVLESFLRENLEPNLIKKAKRIGQYESKDLTGLQAHLNLLINSELGSYFEKSDKQFNLSRSIAENAVIYFALPALRYPSFSKVLGKLIINDLKTVIDQNDYKKRIFTIFDEFSVFAGEQVLNLVNMGRGKGIHAVFGTQGFADLKKVDDTFENQILNCVNTLICHRLNDHESAEMVTNWIGTAQGHDITAQISTKKKINCIGSLNLNKSFIVHPDEIKKNLMTGQSFYVSKANTVIITKIQIKC